MQLRYLGDSHDYMKYALLRHLQDSLKVKIGVNWYLTDPESNRDGEQRHHMTGDQWEGLDQDLFEKLKPFQDPSHRHFTNLEKGDFFHPSTPFFSEKVPTSNLRSVWHNKALTALAGSDLVFLDPDNGFEVASMTNTTQPKYALYCEAAEFAERGKIVVGIQFARQCDPAVRARSVREALTKKFPHSANIPVIRCRVSPNILFLTMAPRSRVTETIRALESFEKKSPVDKGKKKRVEIIS